MPRQIQNPVNISADDAHFGSHRRHLVEAFQFLESNLLRFFRQVRCLQFFLQVGGVAGKDIPFAKFGLDLLHLLTQIELPLTFIHFVLHARVDLVFQFQHIHFLRQQIAQLTKARLRVE